jgi:hypothetical protein
MSEMERKTDGENLAKIAAKQDIGAKQLRNLYIMAKSREIPYIEASVKNQMVRLERSGYWPFGEEVLKILKKYENDKVALVDVLRYMNMLADYFRAEPLMNLRPKVDEFLRTKLRFYGYQGMSAFSVEQGSLKISVRLDNFRDDPRRLAQELAAELRSKLPETAGLNPRIWIELPYRR